MLISDAVKSLLQNDKELCKKAINTLLKIANNIITHPNEAKFRRINLNSDATEKSLLPAIGALEILFLMGFEEGSDKLLLPDYASLDIITSYRDQLEQLKRENIPEPSTSEETPRKYITPKRILSDSEIARLIASEEEMRNELEHQFLQILLFENRRLQEEAKKAIPYAMLSKKAKEREAALKEENPSEKNLNFQDCILIELLTWFKEEYFSWFNHGYCKNCSKNMKFVGHVPVTSAEKEFGGHRVEKYECESCKNEVRFTRYFHPGKLLKTRTGRCMEWASCFTLMCRALGLDARYVVDETDHVWTEVFSESQNRWLHADCCESKLDCPLMYEVGWKKELSYIFAYSKDEIVDCVWRYSANHKAVCSRRKRCREDWLAATLYAMNRERQRTFPQAKKDFLEIRLVKEIAEFFTPPKARKEEEHEGRLSGALSWRLSRGETSDASNLHKFIPTDEEVKAKSMEIKYSASKDLYVRCSNDERIRGWKSGVFMAKNLFRKHEKDWNIVYLSRTDGTIEGEAKWRFEWSSLPLQVEYILVVFQHKTYQDGVVDWQVCCGDICFPGDSGGVMNISKDELGEKCTHVEVSARLSKGVGDVAYQHAQLFRQGDRDNAFPFYVKIKFV